MEGNQQEVVPIPQMHRSCLQVLQSSISSVQFSRAVVSDLETAWTAARQASLSITNSWILLKIHVQGVCDAIQPSHPLSAPSPPTFHLSQHQGLFK